MESISAIWTGRFSWRRKHYIGLMWLCLENLHRMSGEASPRAPSPPAPVTITIVRGTTESDMIITFQDQSRLDAYLNRAQVPALLDLSGNGVIDQSALQDGAWYSTNYDELYFLHRKNEKQCDKVVMSALATICGEQVKSLGRDYSLSDNNTVYKGTSGANHYLLRTTFNIQMETLADVQKSIAEFLSVQSKWRQWKRCCLVCPTLDRS